MQLLISLTQREEVSLVLDADVDILDVKNPQEGSLGAPSLELLRDVVQAAALRGGVVSAALGDLSFQPGTAALAAWGAAVAGAGYVKAGLYNLCSVNQASQVMRAVVQATRAHSPTVRVVAAGYADYARFGGLPPEAILEAACAARCDVVMLDTAIKDGASLLDALPLSQLGSFIDEARRLGLRSALAGSLLAEQMPVLRALGPDIVGVRGAVCRGRRRDAPLCPDLLQRLRTEVRQGSLTRPPSSEASV